MHNLFPALDVVSNVPVLAVSYILAHTSAGPLALVYMIIANIPNAINYSYKLAARKRGYTF